MCSLIALWKPLPMVLQCSTAECGLSEPINSGRVSSVASSHCQQVSSSWCMGACDDNALPHGECNSARALQVEGNREATSLLILRSMVHQQQRRPGSAQQAHLEQNGCQHAAAQHLVVLTVLRHLHGLTQLLLAKHRLAVGHQS